ncbi:hypothetical protein ACFYWS_37600 [Streptomyces sp. NPDC002795]|uniref:hypothetical protein n=1 Tax=Streptomyces sp. NPDC002795 TaxID=3364665 RepID=UPI0036C67D4F
MSAQVERTVRDALDHDWAAQHTTAGAPTLLVQPDPYVGLLPEHLLTVVLWAAGLPSNHQRQRRSPAGGDQK